MKKGRWFQMSSLQELVFAVARKATTATERRDTQRLVQKSSLQELVPVLTRNAKTFKGEKGH
jgi:hypothetical protein